MATTNPFDLLIDDDAGDPSALLAAYEQKAAADAAAAAAAAAAVATTNPAKLSSKQLHPTQAGREARNGGGRGGRGYSRGNGANGASSNRDNHAPNENGFTVDGPVQKPYEKRNGFDDDRGRAGRRAPFSNGDADGERPRRNYERRSGTGRGSEIKRDGAGRGNWGTTNDDIVREVEEPIAENEVIVAVEKPTGEEEIVDAEKETTVKKVEEEPEAKQYTLEEYEKILEEKRKALLSLSEQKKGERKIDVKDFQNMHLVSKKKNDDEVFIKLDSEKDKKRDAAEREEKSKKSVSINEFLKPAEGETHYRSGGRGRGRGRGDRGGRNGGGGGYARNNGSAPAIADAGQFPALGGK
ncbi:hypothetical protein KSS87_009579 [Heliosperma pusillum]|nr:hypothetical protein KSS87_009579 [Heliosperma pusillum]